MIRKEPDFSPRGWGFGKDIDAGKKTVGKPTVFSFVWLACRACIGYNISRAGW